MSAQAADFIHCIPRNIYVSSYVIDIYDRFFINLAFFFQRTGLGTRVYQGFFTFLRNRTQVFVK